MGIFRVIYRAIPLKKQLFSAIRFLFIPPYSVYKHLRYKGVASVKVGDKSFKINTDYDKYLETKLFWKGINAKYDKLSYELWVRLSSKSNVILDVGANTGIYSLLAKTINPKAEVFAFEPINYVHKQLQENIDLNSFDITVESFAVSNQNGTASIFINPNEKLYTASLNKGHLNQAVSDFEELVVKTERLDTWIRDNKIKNIDLMKIDVESYEPQVLEGMGEFLVDFKPAMLMEILNNEVGAMVQAITSKLGYLYFNLPDEGAPILVGDLRAEINLNHLICSPEDANWLGLI